MALPNSINDRQWQSFGKDNEAAYVAAPVFNLIGGWVKSSAQTYSDGDVACLSIDTSGRVRCILEGATFTVSGSDMEVDVSAFRGTTGVTDRQDAWLYSHDEDLSSVSEKWQGFGGYDETADLFRAYPIATDNAAMPANAQFIPIGGEYNATLPTYGDGDAAVFQLDSRGRIITAVELNDYTDDSTEFTVASSKMLAIGGIATTDEVDANDVGAFAMSVKRSLHVKLAEASSADLTSGVETVAGAGTAEQLNGGASLTVGNGFAIVVKALDTNTNKVYVGNSGVDSTNGYQLNPCEGVTLQMNDVNLIYIDVDTNGEGVSWIVEAA